MSTYKWNPEVDCFENVEYGGDDWEVIVEGDWVQDCKYQIKTGVSLHKPSGKYYQYTTSRSGSPFSDWEYEHSRSNPPELVEVLKKERTIVETYWEEV